MKEAFQHALSLLVPATDPAPYDPTAFAADLATNLPTILLYVGVAVTGSIALVFGILGIKKGVSFAIGLIRKA